MLAVPEGSAALRQAVDFAVSSVRTLTGCILRAYRLAPRGGVSRARAARMDSGVRRTVHRCAPQVCGAASGTPAAAIVRRETSDDTARVCL